MTVSKKRHKSAYKDGVGILNPQGDFWTPEVFPDAEAARAHFYRFWRGDANSPSWLQYKVVQARQRVTYVGELP